MGYIREAHRRDFPTMVQCQGKATYDFLIICAISKPAYICIYTKIHTIHVAKYNFAMSLLIQNGHEKLSVILYCLFCAS
jgi:hypothetical protein